MPFVVDRIGLQGRRARPGLFAHALDFAHRQPIACVAAAAAALLAFAGICWFALRPAGPDDVARATLHALRYRNVGTLLDLTTPEERLRMHLNQDSVTRFLDRSMWMSGDLPPMRLEKLEPFYPDQVVYNVTAAVPDAAHHYPFRLMVTQSPDGRWHLALSKLLLVAVFVQHGNDDIDATRRIWADLCRETGVIGYRENTSGYMRAQTDGSAVPMSTDQ